MNLWQFGMVKPATTIPTRPSWIQFRPGPHSYRRSAPISAIIYHYTAGPGLENTVKWFKDKCSCVSAHYVIGKEGKIVQMVPLNQVAYHAGPSILAGRKDVNRFSIGIEIVNWGKLEQPSRGQFLTRTRHRYKGPTPIYARGQYWEPFTEAQYQALIRLTQHLLSRFPKITHITGHEDIALPRGRKSDPGPAFDWNRIRDSFSSVFRGHIGPLSNRALPVRRH